MKSLISKQVERFLREQKNYKRWLAVFLCLAVVVTIGTAAALKYKGIAVTTDNEEVEVHMEDASASGDTKTAHVHTDACYEEKKVLICEAGKAEQGHVHDDSCYSVSGGTEELTCDKEEHSHDDSCYTTETVSETVSHVEKDEEGNETTVEETVEHEEKKLTCDKEEHTHGSDCYSVSGGEKTLTCGFEEGEGAAVSDHVHDDSCYEIQKVLICGLEEGEEEPEEEVVVPEEFKEGTLTAKGDDYEVIVSYGAEAEIPENAELKVEEIEKESDTYKEYYEQMVEALSANEDGQEMEITFARLFDITILVDGKEFEPDAKVAVQINYDDAVMEDEEQTGYAVHFPDNGEIEVMDADVKDGKEFGFNQSSFSVGGTVAVKVKAQASREGGMVITLDWGNHNIYVSEGSPVTISFKTTNDETIGYIELANEMVWNIAVEKNGLQVNVSAGASVGGGEFDVYAYKDGNVIGSAHIIITVQDVTNQYEVVYKVNSVPENIEIAEIIKRGDYNFAEEEMESGSVSEENVTLPYNTNGKRLGYLLVKDNSGAYRYFVSDGWKSSKTGEKIEGGVIDTNTVDGYVTSEEPAGNETIKVIELTPDWNEVEQGTNKDENGNVIEGSSVRLPKVRFYIALNSQVQETDESTEVPSTTSFTTYVGETTTNGYYEYVDSKYRPVIYENDSKGQRRVLVASSSTDETISITADIDKEIRKLGTEEGVTVKKGENEWTYRLQEFPTDEEVLKKLRDKSEYIYVDGSLVEKKDMTTDNFVIRWCVFKHDPSDQWHVDGVLVRKQGKLAVTKTFYGDETAIDTISGTNSTFNITVAEEEKSEKGKDEGGKSSPAYTLTLHEEGENDSNNDLGYSRKIENGSEVTYVWELGVTASKTYRVKENNYIYNEGNRDIATLSEYRISNTKVNGSGSEVTESAWRNYTDAGVQVTTESYASDLNYESFRTVNLRNSYLPKNSITVWKYDKNSNAGLKGVTFNLEKNEKIQTVYKKGTDYYLESEDGVSDLEETQNLEVDSNGYLTIHGVESRNEGTYTLVEANCPDGYKGNEGTKISFEINDNGTVTGNNNITEVDSENKVYRLNIPNDSTEKMKIKAVKNWGDTPAEHKTDSVKVELWRGKEKLSEEVTLNNENNWTYEFPDVYPVYINGEKAEYRLLETAIGDIHRDPGADIYDGYRFYDVTVDKLNYKANTEGRVGEGTITVHNSVSGGGSFSFIKTDTAGNRLSGAKFALYAEDDSQCTGDKLKVATSSETGEVRFTGLTGNAYYMKEVEAPEGYKSSEQIYTVTFENNNGKIELVSGTTGELPEGGTVAGTGPITTITNEVATQTIDIVKVDEANERLNGAVFSLKADKLAAQGDNVFEETSYTSEEINGESGVVVKGLELPYGTYTLTETKAPAGYQSIGTITLTVSKDGVSAEGAASDFTLTPVGGAEATPPTSYALEVKNAKGSLSGITLTKIGDQNQYTKLGGATFILGRGKDGEETGKPEEYAVIKNGIVIDWAKTEDGATPIVTATKADEEEGKGKEGEAPLPALGKGSYYLIEKGAPEGYVLLTAPVKFIIRDSDTKGLELAVADKKVDNNNIVISNSMGIELPEAGGPGTVAYTFGGLAVIAVGLMYGLSMRRKREKGGLN